MTPFKFTTLQRAFLDNIPDMAWLKDRHSRYEAVNDAYVKACGLSQSQIVGKSPREIWPREIADVYVRTDRAVLRRGEGRRYEEMRTLADGTVHWFDTIKSPVVDEEGRITGTVGISRDITDRKAAEAALIRLNQLYAARSQIHQVMVRADNEHKLIERTCRILKNIGKIELVVATAVDEHSSETLLAVVAQAPVNRDRVRGIFANGPISSGVELEAENVRSRWGHSDDASPLIRSILQACELHFFTTLLIVKGGKGAYSLTLAANADDLLSDEVGQVMAAFSDDLSFALDAMAETQRRREVEIALRDSRQRLRELSLFRQTMIEQERKRISRELHDELGQTLTAIKLGLGWMRDRTATSDNDLLGKIHEIMSMVDTAVVDLRRIASDLRPLMLDELGLVAAIEWLASSFAERNGISVALSLAPLKTELPPDISTAAFRIVQEALTNVVRHAKASRVEITTLERDGILAVTISDNGEGIKPQSSSRKVAFGILGMQERTQMLGGTFQICGNVGKGTTVQVRLPATSQAASDFEHDRFADRG